MTYADTIARVTFWLDLAGSTRHETSEYYEGLNIAQLRYVDENCGVYNKPGGVKGIQLTNLSREALLPLYKENRVLLVSLKTMRNGLKGIAIPTDFRHLVPGSMYIETGTPNFENFPCEPILYTDINKVERNPYRKVKVTYPSRSYFYEGHDVTPVPAFGLLYHASIPTIVAAVFEYIKEPAKVVLNAGLVDIPESGHDLICRYAAEAMLMKVQDYDKVNRLRQYAIPE